jgi:hypothetical protein
MDAMDINGVKVDLPKFLDAFANCPPDQKTLEADIQSNIRYGRYVEALADLDTLSKNSGLTPAQSKITTTVFNQVKQVIAKSPTPPQ